MPFRVSTWASSAEPVPEALNRQAVGLQVASSVAIKSNRDELDLCPVLVVHQMVVAQVRGFITCSVSS